MLSALMHSAGASEGVLFVFIEKPSMLNSVAAEGFALIPEPSIIPLLPRHVHALSTTQGAVLLSNLLTTLFSAPMEMSLLSCSGAWRHLEWRENW